MLTIPLKPPAELALQLITHYSFDLGGYKPHDLIILWQSEYPVNWLHLAVIEALYQGRYKAISVQQILNFWQRKDEATYHFNMEFERMICSKFPQRLNNPSVALFPTVSKSEPGTQQRPVIEKHKHNTNYNLLPAQINHNYSDPQITSTDIEPVKYNNPNHHTSKPAQPLQLVASVSNQNNQVNNQEIEEEITRENYQPVIVGGANHPPIGQFTPQKSDRIEYFTSKLKAMTMANLEFVF